VKLGFRIQKSAFLPFSYAKKNYPLAAIAKKPVIFDVGANIGQSAIWYAAEFPEAEIHSFEPFEAIYRILSKSVRGRPRIIPQQLALGEAQGTVLAPRVFDPYCQTGSISIGQNGEELEEIQIDTLDAFTARNNIQIIHILKTDTEGYDLDVLKGSKRMLSEGKILHVLSEATILSDDTEHTQLRELEALLSEFGMSLRSILDLHHDPITGELLYFNALFTKQ